MGSQDVSLPHTATGRPGAVGVHVCACVAWVCALCVHACAAFAMPLGMFCWCGSVATFMVVCVCAMHACAWCVYACVLELGCVCVCVHVCVCMCVCMCVCACVCMCVCVCVISYV